jgi:hypothetical protein
MEIPLRVGFREFCPACGDFVNDLDAETGWCLECSGSKKSRCLNCQKFFTKDQPHRKLCGGCRHDRWLLRHADQLEEFLARGATIKLAIREVYAANQSSCIVCGGSIREGTNFCTKNLSCRRWRRRYRTLRVRYQSRRVIDPSKQALSQVSAEIFAENYNMEL